MLRKEGRKDVKEGRKDAFKEGKPGFPVAHVRACILATRWSISIKFSIFQLLRTLPWPSKFKATLAKIFSDIDANSQ